jgi:DsbC/DsbD-like thiol-disulfide interchange protein/cytochrome c biogenesis protein CcdA
MGTALIRKFLGLMGLAALLLSAPASAASREAREHYDAELVPESLTPAAGSRLTMALHIKPKPGWHIYWSNPGESGYAPTITWTMPTGFSVKGDLRHPAPVSLVAGGLTSFVHEGGTVLLQDIALPRGLGEGDPVRLTADVDLLICSEGTCVPDPVTLDANVTIGSGAANPASAPLFTRARAALPLELAGEALFVPGKGHLSFFLPELSATGGEGAHLFLNQPDVVKPNGSVRITKARGGIFIETPAGAEVPGAVQDGVIVIGGKAYAFHAAKAKALPAGGGSLLDGLDGAFVVAFFTAVLGGLLLNLMPCVFPILSLKALALVKYGETERQAKVEALGYSLGTIGTVAALGAVLLLLRSGGSAAGWAFQLQNPVIVGGLLLLVVAIAMNLAGLFELPSPSVSGGHKSGFVGSMGTGALAAFIATPCTGPFMAGALGAALVMPPLAALLVMSGLGVGMALPFFCIGFFKPVRKWMPRPGNWMVTLRRVLSIPMFATAVGLAWIMGQLGGVSAMAIAIASSVLLGLGLWWYGMRQHGGKTGVPAFVVLASSLALVVFGIVPTTVEAQTQTVRDELNSVPFSEARLAELRDQGKPVFLYLTADWCLTCKVNEATSLSADSVASAAKASGVTVMRGDWTRQDPAISAFLKAHGRAGVPLYLWYPAGGGDARELPQVLTPGLMVETMTQRT